jgi:hypothetical protein
VVLPYAATNRPDQAAEYRQKLLAFDQSNSTIGAVSGATPP